MNCGQHQEHVRTPAERVRFLCSQHVMIEYPVACCRKDYQNWPCSTIQALEAAAAAERERIAQMAERVGAEYPGGDDGEACCDADCHKIWKSFADLLRDPTPATKEPE